MEAARGHDEELDDICDGILTAFQGWCFSGTQAGIEESTNNLLINGGGSNRPNAPQEQMEDGDIHSRDMVASGNDGLDLEGVSSSALQAMWSQHLDDEQQAEKPRIRRFERQESISTLEETGAGSFAHLNMLSSGQLREMKKMVKEYDTRYWQNGDHAQLAWLDSICA